MAKKAKPITPEQVQKITEDMQQVERLRASDRALIDNLFNGGRPYSKEEEEKYQIHCNVNWQEGSKLIQDANRQINSALIFKERFFTATSKGGKTEKRDDYSQTFTKNIHDILKHGDAGQKFLFLLKSRNAALSLHGIGPVMWANDFRWMPKFVALEDLLIPTDTLIDFCNMNRFAVNMYLTQGEFFEMTHGEHVDKGWNIKAVRRILDDLSHEMLTNDNTYTFDQPEKRVEQLKQNRCYLDTDAVPTVKLRMYYYQNPDTHKWHRCAILREGTANQTANSEFIYDGVDNAFADSVKQMLHSQFGDNSICAPLKYHSVRGLGVMLYSPIECNNRVRCEMVQHVLQNLKTLLRVENPLDRDRPKVLDLSQYSVVEQGISIIPNTERHMIDSRLVEYVQSQMRQLMSESSASFVQDSNDGTSKEMTATETNARVQSVNVQVSGMLQSMYAQETFFYEEIVRRFLQPNSDDEDVKRFRDSCIRDGIPKELMGVDNWRIDVERVLGAGDQFLANQEANALLGNSQRFDPTAQRTILRKWVTTTTRNPAMGELLVPTDPNQATPGVIAAEDVFGTLMQGIPASIREGIDRTSYVESLLGMMGQKVEQITSIDNMGTPQEVIGLQTVADHIGKNLQILSGDKTQKSNVKMYGDELGKITNLVKGFEQRIKEKQQEAANQVDPAVAAKAHATAQAAQQKMEINNATTEQKMTQRQQEFEQKMAQMIESHRTQMAIEMQRTQADLTAAGLKAGSDIANAQAKTEADIAAKKKQADAAATAAREQPVSKKEK